METTDGRIVVQYWIDEKDVIVETNSTWDEFALQNDGESCLSTNVLGHSLWDFVNSDVTRMWIRTLLALARQKKEPISRPYRCDSPGEKRFMEMWIEPESSGRVRLEHRLLKTEDFPKPVHFMYESSDQMKANCRCSICNRVKVRDGWIEGEQLYQNETEEFISLRVIYGVCPDCMLSLPGSPA